jgi:hypothetical protein
MTADLDFTNRDSCGCCGEEPAVGVASIPFIPMSIAWGRKCLEAGVIPYWAAVSNTAACGGFEHTNEEWRYLVEITLAYFGKQHDDFLVDVARDIEAMDEAVKAETAKALDGMDKAEMDDDVGF